MAAICTSSILAELICKKRDGHALETREIKLFVDALMQIEKCSAQVRDPSSVKPNECQIGAMIMAMYQQGLDNDETTALTKAIARSGDNFKWPDEWAGTVVDKHSTGGVGDKVSHVLVPALAACGLKVPMISGRSVDIAGGTLDKLESIPGFRISLTKNEMESCLRDVGCFIAGQTEELVPADKILSRLRELTGTVPSSSLITASILSKKVAEDLSALVFDVKYGRGALVKTEQEARALAQRLVTAAHSLGMQTSALLTTMDTPLGKQIGNTLETVEALSCLQGGGPADLLELVEGLGGELLFLTHKSQSRDEGAAKIHDVLQNGQALAKFQQMIIRQGVAEEVAKKLCSPGEDPWSILPRAKHLTKLTYEGKKGYVISLNAEALAKVWIEELSNTEGINYGVGVELTVQQGDVIHPGHVWVRVHHDSDQVSESQVALLKSSLRVGRKNRIKDIITPLTTRHRKTTLPPVHVYRETWESAFCDVKGAMG